MSGRQKYFSRKGAKRYRVSKVFLCAFAPLREKYSSDYFVRDSIRYSSNRKPLHSAKHPVSSVQSLSDFIADRPLSNSNWCDGQ